jgi:nucleoid-associated protein YgaU
VSDYDPTRPFASDEPDPAYDWDDEPPSPKLLWGRVIALAAVLILAFLLGRATAPDDSAEEVEQLQGQLEEAADRIAELEDELEFGATPTAPETTPPETPTDEESPDAGGGGGDGGGGGGDEVVKEYTVQTGDTYNEIAEQFFNDPSLGSCIAEANEDETLIVGETINVPMSCEEGG